MCLEIVFKRRKADSNVSHTAGLPHKCVRYTDNAVSLFGPRKACANP